MIRIEDRTIVLETKNTLYLMHADGQGHLFHLHYGSRFPVNADSVRALMPRTVNPNGCSVIADAANASLCLDDARLECSFRGKGDMREPFAELVYGSGARTCDFRFESAELLTEKPCPSFMPGAYFEETPEGSSVCVHMYEKNSCMLLDLFYTVYEDCDCITRFARVTNGSEFDVRLERLMSLQLDLEMHTAEVTAFRGDWTREMTRREMTLRGGKWVNDSATGFSSNQANPFIMVAQPGTTETSGECYGVNLIYSGNHRESVEINGHGNLRISTGINPDFLSWKLGFGASFDSPEAVLTRSDRGYAGISENMHAFVREHIVRGPWKRRERPVLINSWEAMYFDVSEKRLVRLAEAAKDIGIELFVMDDGWFCGRDNDTRSLGDWKADAKKLPNGLEGLSAKIKGMGLMFGIWVEPEMVNADSDLFRAHPDWAVKIPDLEQAKGRNQLLLDLTREDVRSYIIESMTDVFNRGSVDYVKWDMNRHFSDMYSSGLAADRQGEFSVRYIRGLYAVLEALTKRFPDILFEACASGGNRFDLGMLCYMPQVWASDCTDPVCRAEIQNGCSYGYP